MSRLLFCVLTLASFFSGYCQYFQMPYINDFSVEVNSINSMATNNDDIGFDYNQMNARLCIPLVKSVQHHFPLMKIHKHNELEKFTYSKPAQNLVYAGYTFSRYQLYHQEQNYTLSLGFQGYQYRRFHSFIVYRFNYSGISMYSNNDYLNIFTGYIGYLKQMGSSKSIEFGLYPVLSKDVQLFIPYVAFRIISGAKFQSYIHLPTELKVTYMHREHLFFSARAHLNTDPGVRIEEELKKKTSMPFLYNSLMSGVQMKWKVNNSLVVMVESGWEFKNDLIYPTLDKEREKVEARPYLNFSCSYTPSGKASINYVFDYK